MKQKEGKKIVWKDTFLILIVIILIIVLVWAIVNIDVLFPSPESGALLAKNITSTATCNAV